ncbi:MAG: kelch repeat-containing protein, partial [Calditrichota bacterium]
MKYSGFSIVNRTLWLYLATPFLVVLSMSGFAEQWRNGPSLVTARFGAQSVLLNNQIYVIGGLGPGGIMVDAIETLGPAAIHWEDQYVSHLFVTRVDGAAAVWNGNIYITGGQNSNNQVIASTEVYNSASNSWSTVGSMIQERRGHVLAILNGHLIAIGGIDNNDEYVSEIEYYNAPENKWLEIQGEFIAQRVVPFSGVFNNQLKLFGGILSVPVSSGFNGIFDSNWNVTWKNLPELTEARGNGISI